MRARVWGCRGSIPAPAPDTVRYGGNTSCVELNVDEDTVIVLDAGSGMRPLGCVLAAAPPRAVHVLLTHLHLDHLQGLAFFLPFWSDNVELHIWGPSSPNFSLAQRVASYVSPPLFPVHLSDVPSRPIFHDVPDEPWMIGSALVAGYPVVHQGPTLGFRVTADNRTLAYIPDHEPSLGIDLRQLEPDWMSGYRVAEGADVLLHDAQYSGEEYATHTGWGHSSIDHAVSFARAAQVERLLMFHHDPSHTDTELEVLRDEAQSLWAGPRPPMLAAEGMTLRMERAEVTIDPPAGATEPLAMTE
jgi:phosphoribosyl 1,2-cyclic phosphodiesterase